MLAVQTVEYFPIVFGILNVILRNCSEINKTDDVNISGTSNTRVLSTYKLHEDPSDEKLSEDCTDVLRDSERKYNL
jgi:hypothetical protein